MSDTQYAEQPSIAVMNVHDQMGDVWAWIYFDMFEQCYLKAIRELGVIHVSPTTVSEMLQIALCAHDDGYEVAVFEHVFDKEQS